MKLSSSSSKSPCLLLLVFLGLPVCQTTSVAGHRIERSSGRLQQVTKDSVTTFTLPSPLGEEEAVELRLFGVRLAHVTGLRLQLHPDSGNSFSRQLLHVPSRSGDSPLSELRWSVCGAAGVVSVDVQALWDAAAAQGDRRVYCEVTSRNILLSEGADWDVRLGSLGYRRVPWSPAEAGGPASLAIRSADFTDAVACLKHQCVDDSAIDSLSAVDDVTCQEFTDCAVFDIPQGRPSYLYIRPGASARHQIGKVVRVRFAAGPLPDEWTSLAAAAPVGRNTSECRRHRWGGSLPVEERPAEERDVVEGVDVVMSGEDDQTQDEMFEERNVFEPKGNVLEEEGNVLEQEREDKMTQEHEEERGELMPAQEKEEWGNKPAYPRPGSLGGMVSRDETPSRDETVATSQKGSTATATALTPQTRQNNNVIVRTTVTVYRPRQPERPQQTQTHTNTQQQQPAQQSGGAVAARDPTGVGGSPSGSPRSSGGVGALTAAAAAAMMLCLTVPAVRCAL